VEPDHRRGDHGELRVAIGGRKTSDWLFTVAHEYAHFLQWMRDDPIWREKDYFTFEMATEAEALDLCKTFKLPIPRRVLLKEHRRYVRKLRASGC
jgi:Zn-dependent peptidase ImmA (M78 family)